MESIMYTPFHLGKIQISNRLAASAMFEYGADNGKIMVEKALTETKITAISFGRPLVREPDLPDR